MKRVFFLIILFAVSGCASGRENQPQFGKSDPAAYHFQMGVSYLGEGNYTSALFELDAAEKLDPDNPELLFNLGEILEMIGLLNMSNKYLDSAIATFKMVINQLPNNKDTWNHIGICYQEKGQIEESKFYFDRARDIHIANRDTPIVPKRDF